MFPVFVFVILCSVGEWLLAILFITIRVFVAFQLFDVAASWVQIWWLWVTEIMCRKTSSLIEYRFSTIKPLRGRTKAPFYAIEKVA